MVKQPSTAHVEETDSPVALSLEHLESRLNLSTLATVVRAVPAGAGDAAVQNVSTTVRYRIDSYANGQAGGTYGTSYTNPLYPQAQKFFDKYKSDFTTYVTPGPGNNVTPPDPGPTNPPPSSLPPVTITQDPRGSLTQLTITGTSGNDSILVSESGDTLTITANGTTSTVSGTFAEIAIYGGTGDDNITVQSSVTISTLLYGGTGNNTIDADASAQSFVVTLGGGNDNVTGNGINTSFWVDPGDTVHATPAETAGGDVHRVASFYQPFTTNSADPNYVPTTLGISTLAEPTDSGSTTVLKNVLWGAGPSMTDVNQGQVGDCYFLASIQSLALEQPAKLQEMAVDLGDGTYAVQFMRNNTPTYVRVDADMPVANWGGLLYDSPSNGGAMWSAIMEKAYAYFRTAANTYASLNWGWTGSAMSDLGISTTTFYTGSNSIFSALTTALASNKAVAAITNTNIVGGAPIIGSHAYTVVSTAVQSGVQYVTVRNPWGVDGIGDDGNPNDGLVTVTLAQFQANFSSGSIEV